jgi:large subunit ribosomal protein L25
MKFTAFERNKQGTGASRRLRISGRTPAIVYGGSDKPQNVELDHNNLWHALKKEAFHASILDMEIDGKTSQVLLRDVQYHPFKPMVLHIDFQRVLADQKITMKVPLHFSGQDLSPAVKTDNCLVNHVLNEIQVSCLPADLPEFIAVDLSAMHKGSALHVADLVLPKGVSAVVHGKVNPVVVSVTAIEVEVVAAPVAPAADAKGKAGAKAKPAAAPAKDKK